MLHLGIKVRVVFWLVVKLILLGFFVVGCVNPPNENDLVSIFVKNKAVFVELRELILEEVSLSSIGDDNVGGFWLSGEEWINHQSPYKRYTRQEMLDLVSLSPERYEKYLDLLHLVGGYRVSKELSEGRVVIHIFKSGGVSSETAVNIVYFCSTPKFLLDAEYVEIGDGWYVERIGE
jgi:hypothetical protein